MKFELDIRDEANGGANLHFSAGEGTLGEYAEFIRQHLNIVAVVVTIANPFARLFEGVDASGGRASTSQVCALAPDARCCEEALAAPGELADPVTATDLGFGFYAGIPLRLSSGNNAGMLAAIDSAPRSLVASELATLKMLANIVIQMIEFRLATSGDVAGRT